jgi:hypothetical protein
MRAAPRVVALGADKGCDAAGFVGELRELNLRPPVARKARRSAIDGRSTRHAGYAASRLIRKRVEMAFGWLKTITGLRKPRVIGRAKTDWTLILACAACDLVRLPTLMAGAG